MQGRIVRSVVIALACAGLVQGRWEASAAGRAAPPFPSGEAEAWIGPPQSLAALRGKVVLLDVWTFG